MDERANQIAAIANATYYDAEGVGQYAHGAPHIKHAALRRLYGALVVRVFDRARRFTPEPLVLDLGAGEGTVTLPFLELGARVVAVDISPQQLAALQAKCERYGDALDVRCEDITATLRDTAAYDIIVVNSFLHHIPDYLGLIGAAVPALRPHGLFFAFQDPLRYDSLSRFASVFSRVAYLSWRIPRGDVIGGLRRWWRRSRGIYLEHEAADNAEYHVMRNGVDQDAIAALLRQAGLHCRIIPYFSTQSRLFQPLGTLLGIKNTFAVVAWKGG